MNGFQLDITQISIGLALGLLLGIIIMLFVNKHSRKKFANDMAAIAENLEEVELKLNLSDSKNHKVTKEYSDLDSRYRKLFEEYNIVIEETKFLLEEFDKEKLETERLKALEIELTNELNQMHVKNNEMYKDLIFATNEKNRLKAENDMLKR